MNDTDALLGIGAFAHQVGLAPSALRFYDDCGVLRPAFVDEATGYRYYHPDQERRAVLLRRLRKAGMPLTDAVVVLDGDREEARALVEEHGERARAAAAASRSAIEEVLRDLSPRGSVARARVGGAELSSAVRQVAPAVAGAASAREFPVLGGVLVEFGRHEVRLVATDRYRLAVRTLRPCSLEGGPRQVVVEVPALRDAARHAAYLDEVGVEFDGRMAGVRGGGRSWNLPVVEGSFPDYRLLLEDRPAVRHRLITDRTALRDRVADGAGPVTLGAEEHRLTVTGGRRTGPPLPAIHTGPPLRIAFDPAVLLASLDAGVGPDVLLEVASATGPVVVRSADQGSFTTLVMPIIDGTDDVAGPGTAAATSET